MAVSNDPNKVLVTYSLGSCLGIAMYDPDAGVGGLLHCMLPMSKSNHEKAKDNPAMFTDTGFVALLQAMFDAGASKSNLVIKVAGGGAPLDSNGRFKIGERNFAVLRKLMWKNDLLFAAEDVGGSKPRTMRLRMNDGKVVVSTGKEVTEL